MDSKKLPSKYLVSPGWGHIFVGTREETTRWIYDTSTESLVSAQVLNGSTWNDLEPALVADLLEDIHDNDAVESAVDFGLVESKTLPSWDDVLPQSKQVRDSIPMMHIEKREQGWTVVNQDGEIRLHTKEGAPMYLSTREEVAGQCNANGMYQAAKNNPGGWPEGTLLEFSVDVQPERPRG